MNHPTIDLALELVRERLTKLRLPVPPWLGTTVIGPRVMPGQQRNMPEVYTITSGQHLRALHLTGGRHVGLSHTASQGPLRDFTLADSIFDHHLMWASRTYENESLVTWDHVLVADVWREHGDYSNLRAGDPAVPCKIWKGCAFIGIGGQAVQTAQRGWEAASIESMGEGGPLIHDGGIISHAGRNREWGRASFAISHHARQWNKQGVAGGFPTPSVEPYQNDIIIRRQSIDLTVDPTCRGALLAEGRRRLVRLEECPILCSTLEQPLALVRDADRLELVGCTLHASGGQAWIQADRVGALVTTGCIGNVGVHRGVIDDGSIQRERG
jgi:hypothetical protein